METRMWLAGGNRLYDSSGGILRLQQPPGGFLREILRLQQPTYSRRPQVHGGVPGTWVGVPGTVYAVRIRVRVLRTLGQIPTYSGVRACVRPLTDSSRTTLLPRPRPRPRTASAVRQGDKFLPAIVVNEPTYAARM